jgi:tetratricopeptide (TPR) repeat protein
MTSFPARLLLLPALAIGCASAAPAHDAPTRHDESTPAVATPASTEPGADAAADPATATTTAPVTQHHAPSAYELALWASEDFQRRFTESYIAETEIEPRITGKERDMMQDVLELISDDKMDEARELLEEERQDAVSAVVDFTLANIYFQQDELEPAAEVYADAVAKYPRFRRAWRNMALVHVRLEQFEEAAPALTRVLELGGGDAITYGLLGVAYSNLDNEISAESAFRMAILLDPDTVDWKMYLARSFFKQGRFADAVALTGRLIEEAPDRPDYWLLQANAYIGLEDVMHAAQNYEFVDRMGGSTPDSLRNLGDIYINEELFDMAVDAYVRAIGAEPGGDLKRPIRAASQLTAHGALDEATRLIDHLESGRGEGAGELSEEDRIVLLRLRARIAVAQGSGDEEARILEQIVTLDPLDGEALILLGQHASRNEDPERAIFYYERAASLEAFEADAKVRHAQLLVGLGRYPEALPLLRRAQALKPRDNIQEYLEQVERVAQTR